MIGVRRGLGVVVASLVATVLLTGCGGELERPTLHVLAASSLKAPFEALAADYSLTHDVDVVVTVGGSADLVAQLQEGAPADVIATADLPSLEPARAGDLLSGDPTTFASNHLVIAVPAGNPADITTAGDLERDGLRLVVCAPEVPCGRLARQVADAAGISLRPVSEESSVSEVIAKILAGEADAGLVYASDVVAAGGGAEQVDIPEALALLNHYPIALTRSAADGDHADLAQGFIDLVLGADGQRELAADGFGPP